MGPIITSIEILSPSQSTMIFGGAIIRTNCACPIIRHGPFLITRVQKLVFGRGLNLALGIDLVILRRMVAGAPSSNTDIILNVRYGLRMRRHNSS